MTGFVAATTAGEDGVNLIGEAHNDVEDAQKVADEHNGGQVMRLVPEDFISPSVESAIARNADIYNAAIRAGSSPSEARKALPELAFVELRWLDAAAGLLEYEVKRQEQDPDYDPHADTDHWRRTRDNVKAAVERQETADDPDAAGDGDTDDQDDEGGLPVGWSEIEDRTSTIAYFITGFTDGDVEIRVWGAPDDDNPVTSHLAETEVSEGDDYMVEVMEGDELVDEYPLTEKDDAVSKGRELVDVLSTVPGGTA